MSIWGDIGDAAADLWSDIKDAASDVRIRAEIGGGAPATGDIIIGENRRTQMYFFLALAVLAGFVLARWNR